MTEFFLASPYRTLSFGRKIASILQRGDVVCLEGSLGAGKTTLAKGIAEGLSIEESVTSPTFSLVNEYRGKFDLFHMDLYRLSSSEEFEEIGGPEYFERGGVCLIEWSERIQDLLPREKIVIRLEILEKGRKLVSNRDFS